MRVLIACECTGTVRDEFLAAGVDAWSCDIKTTEAPGPHIQGDALKAIGWGWDLMVCHPECRYLSSSGLFRNIGNPERQHKTEEALAFAMALWNAPIPFIAMENPVGRIGTTIGRAQQTVQPYEFGRKSRSAINARRSAKTRKSPPTTHIPRTQPPPPSCRNRE